MNPTMKTRRDFLRSVALAGAYIFTKPYLAKAFDFEANPVKETGIQLWGLRDLIRDELVPTLKAVSTIGYTGIEAFDFDGSFYGHAPKDFKQICTDLDLKIYSSHTPITDKNANLFAEKASEAGLEYLFLPSFLGRPANTINDFKRTAEELNRIGQICRQFNIQFGYHNHEFEFKPIGDQLPYDVLLEETDPGLVSFQLDIYWIVKSGFEPSEYFTNHPGRFHTWHIKDMGHNGETLIVGNGTIDFKSLMKYSQSSGLKLMIVEQDNFTEGTPLYCSEQSLRYIHSNLF